MTDTESDVHRSSVTYPRAFVRRVASVTRARPAGGPVTEADLDGLPAAAVRDPRFMNVVGKANRVAVGRRTRPVPDAAGRTLDGLPHLAVQHRGPRAAVVPHASPGGTGYRHDRLGHLRRRQRAHAGSNTLNVAT